MVSVFRSKEGKRVPQRKPEFVQSQSHIPETLIMISCAFLGIWPNRWTLVLLLPKPLWHQAHLTSATQLPTNGLTKQTPDQRGYPVPQEEESKPKDLFSATPFQTGKTNQEEQIRSGLQSKLTKKTPQKDTSRTDHPAEERRTGSLYTPAENETQVRHMRVIKDQPCRSRKGGTETRQKSEKTITEQQLADKYTKVQLLAWKQLKSIKKNTWKSRKQAGV